MVKRTKQLRTAALLAGAVLLPWTQIAAARSDSTHMKYILVLGDSLSDGIGLQRSQAYPALIVNKLRDAGLNFELTNASASGGTTTGGLRRISSHLKRKIDIFVVELGINDLFLGTPIDEIRKNLQTIIDRVKLHSPNARIIICGMRLPNSTPDDYVGAF